MINSSYILVLSDISYCKRQLGPMFANVWRRGCQSFERCFGLNDA